MTDIVVVGGIKGGTGKTTLAVNLALMEAQQEITTGKQGRTRKKNILLVDADVQSTAQAFMKRREECGLETSFGCIKLEGFAVMAEISAIKHQYDTIIVDAGGGDTQSQRMALAVADLFLVPFVPSPFDVWTISILDEMVSHAQEVNTKLKAFSFLNRVDSRGSDADDAADTLSQFTNLKFSHVAIGSRKAFSRSVINGQGLIEFPHAPARAKGELSFLHEFMEDKCHAPV